MMWIQAETFTTAAEMERAYAARRARLMAPAHRPQKPREAPPAVVVTYRDQEPKDAHILAYAAWKLEQGSPCKSHIKRRCEEMGIPYADVVGSSRFRRYAYARQLLMWEIKTIVKPTIAWPELGRLFNRDHSTAIHAFRKIEAERGGEGGAAWVERKARQATESHERQKQRRKAKAE